MPDIRLIVLAGVYAQAFYLPNRKKTLTETVRYWREYGPRFMPLPHPSPRNTYWLQTHPWFGIEVVSYLRSRVARLCG